jgi:N-acetylmuramoyl-L-alanine amidase
MVQVRQMLVASKNYKTKCPNSLDPEFWTVHNTYNDASANNEVQYMILNHNQVSYHYAIDDKEAVQGIPLDRNAWHAGDGNGPGNRKSLSLEICYSKSGGDRYYKAEENAVQFLAADLKKRGWGIDRVKKHQDWSGKNCPHRILDEGRWTSFLDRVKKAMNPPQSQVKPQPVQGIGTLKVLEKTVIRDKATYLGGITGNVEPEGEYIVHDYQAGWFNIGGWVYSKHVQFIPHADVKMTR